MDATRFDRLTRSFGQRISRRHVVLAAAALIAGPAPTRDARAVVRSTCRPYGTGCSRNVQCCSGVCDTRRTAPRSTRNRCQCAASEVRCDGACTDIADSTDNCGACGHVCDPDTTTTCVEGVCHCGQWAACTGGASCTSGHCDACASSSAIQCLALANGVIYEGNPPIARREGGDPCLTDADCTNLSWGCNLGPTQEMLCLAAAYIAGYLIESYPDGWCQCVLV